MKIGNLTLNGVAALAPMAGATDRPFRELCCSFGAAYCVTEMVSTRALQYNYKKTQELITLGEKEHPVAIQMFGDDPLIFASAAKRAATKNGRAEEATPTVASCPESSFAQASSSAPDLASDADSISINMSVPFGKCRPYRQQTKGRGPGPPRQ